MKISKIHFLAFFDKTLIDWKVIGKFKLCFNSFNLISLMTIKQSTITLQNNTNSRNIHYINLKHPRQKVIYKSKLKADNNFIYCN